MNGFGVRVYGDGDTPVLIPSTLDVEPGPWSGQALGGCKDATVVIRGALVELMGLTDWLGYRIEILNPNETVVWWGDIAAVEITAGGLRRGVSLDGIANKIQVRYSQVQPGGSAIAADTAWASDANSQTRYGMWQRRISPQREMTENEATALRATALGMYAQPLYTLQPDRGDTQAQLTCTGYWWRGKRRYHAQPAGLVENNVTESTPWPLGLGFAASQLVAFSARTDTVHSIGGYFSNFTAGMWVRISGAAQGGNNGNFLITGADDRAAVTYTSSDVTFSPSDDISDANGGLGFVENDDVFTLAGPDSNSGANAGTHLMDKAGAVNVEVNGTYHGGQIVSESAGDTCVFRRGNFVEVAAALVNERVGNGVTVVAWGQRHYQTFVVPAGTAWTVAAVDLRLRRVGGPTDAVRVQLVSDNAGSPGTLLDEVTVAADNIPLDMGWVRFTYTNTVALNALLTYGLVVLRTGSNSPTDCYAIDLDANAGYSGGALKLFDGSGWQTPSPAMDLVFRVLGAQDTGRQVAAAIVSGNWARSIAAVNSGIVANQYRAGELYAFDEAMALLENGTSTGARLLATVYPDLTVSIAAQPGRAVAMAVARYVLHDGAQLTDLHGMAAEPGMLPAGEWVHLGDAADLGPWATLSPVFVERAEYSPSDGWSLEPQGSVDVFDTGVQQG